MIEGVVVRSIYYLQLSFAVYADFSLSVPNLRLACVTDERRRATDLFYLLAKIRVEKESPSNYPATPLRSTTASPQPYFRAFGWRTTPWSAEEMIDDKTRKLY